MKAKYCRARAPPHRRRGLRSSESPAVHAASSAAVGPVADRAHIDVDERAHFIARVAERHRLLNVRKELELVLDVIRREHGAVAHLADVLGAVDDLELPAVVDQAGISGVKKTVG